MRLNARRHAPIGDAKMHRSRRSAGGPATGVLLSLGVVMSGFMLPSAAQPPAAGAAPAPAGEAGAPAGGKLQAYAETLPGSAVKIQMLPVPGGTIKIGTETVTVKPFYMAKTETPWEAYDAFTASGPPSPSYGQEIPVDAVALPSRSYILPDLGWGHNGYPAINVSFLSTQMFCRWLATTTKKKYRLPTEAEWELACRVGPPNPWKADKALLEKSAWYAGNSEKSTHPVGKKAPNKLGLHDMFGNVGEWATDLKGEAVLCGGTFRDSLAGLTPAMRRRWNPKWQETDPQFPKSRWWLADAPFAGFRIVCEP